MLDRRRLSAPAKWPQALFMPLLSRLFREIQREHSAAQAESVYADEIRVLAETGRVLEAQARLQQRLARVPNDPDALHLLGLVRHLRGDHRHAVKFIEEAIARRADVAFYHANLAQVYLEMSQAEPAERHFRDALKLSPKATGSLLGLAKALHQQGRTLEAIATVRRIEAFGSDSSDACALESIMLAATGSLPEAISRIDAFFKCGGSNPALEIQRFLLQGQVCDWRRDRVRVAALVRDWAAHPGSSDFAGVHPFVAWHLDVSEKVRLACTQDYADRLNKEASAGQGVTDFSGRRRAAGRVRLGYLSADFHNHPTMHLARGLFRCHDQKKFEIFAFSLGPDDGGDYRKNVVRDVDHFIDLCSATSLEAAQRVREQRIDVLIDLKGFTLGARPEVLALRSAPVQMTWLGYPATIGAGLADYALVDRIVAPAPEAFGEKLIWMPDCYQVNDQSQEIAEVSSDRSELGLPRGAMVYACFNQAYKIEADVFDVWMRVLKRVPESVLWLYRSNVWSESNLRREAEARGVDSRRLFFSDAVSKPLHLARLRCADLVLDTRLINAHTGASDALWAGVPLLTCPGSGFPARVAASVLAAAGLPDLICPTFEAYEEFAVELGRTRGRIDALKKKLREGRKSMPLFDTVGFVRNLEKAIELAWRRFCDGLVPDHIALPRDLQ